MRGHSAQSKVNVYRRPAEDDEISDLAPLIEHIATVHSLDWKCPRPIKVYACVSALVSQLHLPV